MKYYYVNESEDDKGLNEVHEENCYFLGLVKNKTYIEAFNNEIEAVNHAKNLGYNADGCFFCCTKAHHG